MFPPTFIGEKKGGMLHHCSVKSEKWPSGAPGDEWLESIVSSVKKKMVHRSG